MSFKRSFQLFSKLHFPNAPPGTGTIFTSNTPPVKFALSGIKWTTIVFAGFSGSMAGNFFYRTFIQKKNPPNPPRNPDELAPERHLHSPDED